MANNYSISDLNILFKQMYGSKMTNIVPSGVKILSMPDYDTMSLRELKKHVDISKKAADLYKRRNTKLGRHLEGLDE